MLYGERKILTALDSAFPTQDVTVQFQDCFRNAVCLVSFPSHFLLTMTSSYTNTVLKTEMEINILYISLHRNEGLCYVYVYKTWRTAQTVVKMNK